jgi:hypothetical protein
VVIDLDDVIVVVGHSSPLASCSLDVLASALEHLKGGQELLV